MNVIGWVSWSGERVTIFEEGKVGPKRCVTTGNAWWLSTLRQTIFSLDSPQRKLFISKRILLTDQTYPANVSNVSCKRILLTDQAPKWPANFKTMWLVRRLTSFADTTFICTSFCAWSRSRILNKRFNGLVSEGKGTLGRVCKAWPLKKRLLSEANSPYNIICYSFTRLNGIRSRKFKQVYNMMSP